jgi:hypothetical protein
MGEITQPLNLVNNQASVRDDPVVIQLPNMATALNSLTVMHNTTRSEMGGVMVSRVPAASSALVSQAHVSTPVVVPSHQPFIPTVTAIRVDAHLKSQAEHLVSDLSSSVAGSNILSSSIKQGLVRAGENLPPSVKTPWPQDFVLGSGKKIKSFYEDLSIFEWMKGYMAIVQIQTDPNTTRLMMAHFRNLREDVVFYGWELVKQANSVILSSLESGALTWVDKLQMAKKRRSAMLALLNHKLGTV